MLYSFSMNLNREFKIKKLFVEKIFNKYINYSDFLIRISFLFFLFPSFLPIITSNYNNYNIYCNYQKNIYAHHAIYIS